MVERRNALAFKGRELQLGVRGILVKAIVDLGQGSAISQKMTEVNKELAVPFSIGNPSGLGYVQNLLGVDQVCGLGV